MLYDIKIEAFWGSLTIIYKFNDILTLRNIKIEKARLFVKLTKKTSSVRHIQIPLRPSTKGY